MKDLIASLRRLIDLDAESSGLARSEPGSPATPGDIEAVEKAYGLVLPADYRAFLLLHDGWVGFRYDERLLSTRELLERSVPDRQMLDDYAAAGDVVPRTGLVALAGSGRRFMVLSPESHDWVEYDIGPGARYATFTSFLELQRAELERQLEAAKVE